MELAVGVAQSVVVALSLMVLCCCRSADAYPTGPPTSACSDMTPQHGVSTQTSQAPYRMTTSPSCHTPGQQLRVSLVKSGTADFRGFFVQAKKLGDNSNSYGTFVADDDNATTLDCFSGMKNAISHNSRSDKSLVNFTWTAPSDVTETLQFVATVVQVQTTFWVKGVTLNVNPCQSETTTASAATPTTSGAAVHQALLLLLLLAVGVLLQCAAALPTP